MTVEGVRSTPSIMPSGGLLTQARRSSVLGSSPRQAPHQSWKLPIYVEDPRRSRICRVWLTQSDRPSRYVWSSIYHLRGGIRRIVGVCENQQGQTLKLSDVPLRASECVLQEPTQTALQGRAAYLGDYELRELWVEHLRGVSHVDPPRIGFEVKGTRETIRWRLA